MHQSMFIVDAASPAPGKVLEALGWTPYVRAKLPIFETLAPAAWLDGPLVAPIPKAESLPPAPEPPERALQRLRVKDRDSERREIAVSDGKGGTDRVTLLPRSLVVALKLHLREVRRIHQTYLAAS